MTIFVIFNGSNFGISTLQHVSSVHSAVVAAGIGAAVLAVPTHLLEQPIHLGEDDCRIDDGHAVELPFGHGATVKEVRVCGVRLVVRGANG